MIVILYKILFFLLPLVFYKNTSEIFEFNKIIILYIFTILITSTWIIKSTLHKKFIFSRTILDVPLVTFLLVMLLSTFFSIDPRSSWLGYYSRFNGGFVSLLSYCLLYWSFVSNLAKKQKISVFAYAIAGTLLASILAIFEHFGVGITCGLMGFGWKVGCWVQDVQNRVFSTFGQPNWLAAEITALIPLVWYFIFQESKKQNTSKKMFISFRLITLLGVSLLLFTTLLFTKSKSGLLAFGIESLVFWGFVFFKTRLKFLKGFLLTLILFSISFVFFSPFKIPNDGNARSNNKVATSPALEGGGGTDSGQIRKNVWRGAINIWSHYPILGTGVETYAFAFPTFKPIEHNLVSEWDFIYNKAHNEYLNYLATTGALGFISYTSIIVFSSIIFLRGIKLKGNKQSNKGKDMSLDLGEFLKIGLFSGYLAILITNFFGFSVVPVSALFFLMPALATKDPDKIQNKAKNRESYQILTTAGVVLFSLYLIFLCVNYWRADVYYNKGKSFDSSKKYIEAQEYLVKASNLNPKEPIFLSQYCLNTSNIAIVLLQNDKKDEADIFRQEAINSCKQAVSLSPYNINAKKAYVSALTKLIQFNENYLLEAISITKEAVQISPNDPKLYYQLGLMSLKANRGEEGLEALQKSVELKPNYKEGRFALGLTYKDFGKYDKAKEQLEYILEKIDPNDQTTKKYLEELK